VSVYGIRPNQLPGLQPSRTTPQQPRVDRQPASVPSPGTVKQPEAQQAPGAALPTQAPPGTDPELWAVLTSDERAYFAKLGAMGPLTYGRILTQQSAPPVARGGRIDVKA
jgi:hypothetical protein